MAYSKRCLYCRLRDDIRRHYIYVMGYSGFIIITAACGLRVFGLFDPMQWGMVSSLGVGVLVCAMVLMYDQRKDETERERRQSRFLPPRDKWNPVETAERKIKGLVIRDEEKDELGKTN